MTESSTAPHYLTFPGGERPSIAYRPTAGKPPGIMFLGGFASDMTGTKATELEHWASDLGHGYIRFDYRGHGQSHGKFTDGTIGAWRDDALAVFDRAATGPQILVGSSMGGWVALLLALARPGRVAGLVLIAAAPDFTEDLIWARLDETRRAAIERDGVFLEPSQYSAPLPITRALIEDGRDHLLLRDTIAIDVPVRLIHGMRDPDVPWQTSLRVAERLKTPDVRVALVKDGDHRLSRDDDLVLIELTIEDLIDRFA